MSRSYNKFNSTRSKAEFARNALAGVVVGQLATSNVPTGLAAPPLTGWSGAPTDITISSVGNFKGDSADWASGDSNGLRLEPGTYSFELKAAITCTSAADANIYWALTDGSFNALYESSLGEPMVITLQNQVATLTGFCELELTAETVVELHIALSGAATATMTRGESSQILVRKVG